MCDCAVYDCEWMAIVLPFTLVLFYNWTKNKKKKEEEEEENKEKNQQNEN